MFDIEFLNYVYFIFLGAIFGSFGNVIIYRLPANESVVSPRSRCGQCHKTISWYDNIPLLSWFVLRGRCRNCKARYSFRYVLVEYLMAFAFVACYHQFGFSWFLIEALIFIFGLIVSSFIDIDHMILPDEFTLGGLVLGLIGAALNPQREFLPALIGAFVGGGFLWLMAYMYFLFTKVEGMGGGDIKLLAWIGAVLGWKAIPFVIMTAAIFGSTVGLALAWRQKKGLKTMIPFGPYLALGAIIYLLGGQTIGEWYFHLFLPGF
ncbi:MAG: prepilin peptidase [Bdellovibrionota bacterium]